MVFSSSTPTLQYSVFKHAAPCFQHVHLNDPNLLGPGTGDVDFGPIMATLRDLEFGGWLSLEAFEFPRGPEAMARESLANVQAALNA